MVDEQTIELAEILRRNLEATLNRLDREAGLRERDRELAEQNEELRRLNRLDEIIRSVNRALFTSTTREDIEAAVCSELSDSAVFAGVWIGERGTETGQMSPVASQGFDIASDFTELDGDGGPLAALVDQAITSEDVAVASGIVDADEWRGWRRHALDHGYRVVAAVPIPMRGEVERVLVLHSSEPGLFTDRGQTVFAELGHMIGSAFETVGGRQSVAAEEYTRIELDIGDASLLFDRLITETGGELELRGAIPHADRVRLFLATSTPPGTVRDTVQDWKDVTVHQPDADSNTQEDGGLVVLSAPVPLFDILSGLGCPIRDLTADADGTHVTIDVPGGVAVRDVIKALTEAHATVELRARHAETATVQPPETTLAALEATCTERQLQALRAAYYGGYYEWPRKTTNEALADSLDIASATYQSHRRAAERKLVETVLN